MRFIISFSYQSICWIRVWAITMVMQTSLFGASIKYYGKKLRYYTLSEELPPLLVVNGFRSSFLMGILREEFGSISEGYVEIISLKPMIAPGVLVWIVASLTAKPSKDLLRALTAYTPRAAIELVFELIEISNGYKKSRPLIRPGKLRAASKVIAQMLKLLNYPIE